MRRPFNAIRAGGPIEQVDGDFFFSNHYLIGYRLDDGPLVLEGEGAPIDGQIGGFRRGFGFGNAVYLENVQSGLKTGQFVFQLDAALGKGAMQAAKVVLGEFGPEVQLHKALLVR